MISLLSKSLQILDISLGISLSYLTVVFLIRLILTWYPKIDLNKGFWLLISIPSSSILNLSRKLIPPIGGVDVGPVILDWSYKLYKRDFSRSTRAYKTCVVHTNFLEIISLLLSNLAIILLLHI